MPSCLNTSKPTAAINPARTELRKLTDSRGSRAMIQVNSSQEIKHRHQTATPRAAATPIPGTSCRPSHSSTCFITSELPSTVSAMVMTMRDEHAEHGDEIGQLGAHEARRFVAHPPHIWLSASRRLAIQPRPAHAAVARPMMPTDVRDWIADVHQIDSAADRNHRTPST